MTFKTTRSLAFATACLTAIATMPVYAQNASTNASPPGYSGPQADQASAAANYGRLPNQGNMPSSAAGTSGAAEMTNGPGPNRANMSSSRSAHQNVIQSKHCEQALETNRGFRQARMRKECGPITDPELRQSCVTSFNQGEPTKGSSHPHRTRHS